MATLLQHQRRLPKWNHIAQFYKDDAYLIEGVKRFVAPTLQAGDSAVVIATSAHSALLEPGLQALGVDLRQAAQQGRYLSLDARQTLDSFLVGGWPDPDRFRQVVGGSVQQARTAGGGGHPVVAFGEMVALLWMDGRREAAIQLEQLWNQLAETQSFSLCCAYPLAGFDRPEHRHMFLDICSEHLHVIPAELDHGLRNTAELQQHVQALETEIRLSHERMLLLQDASGLGTWELDCVDDSLLLSLKAQQMLGLRGRNRVPVVELLEQMYYSGDRDAFLAALEKARTGRKDFAAEFRLKTSKSVRVFSTRGRMYYNAGQPIILGVLLNTTPAA